MISRARLIGILRTIGVATLVLAVVCLVVGEALSWCHARKYGAKVWFYNEAARQLYPAAADAIPSDSLNRDGVRAFVITFNRGAKDRKSLRIAYLETYTPDLKHLLERIQAARAAGRVFEGNVPARGGGYFESNTLVRRPADTIWRPVNTPEGRTIMAEWQAWRGPHGERPLANVP